MRSLLIRLAPALAACLLIFLAIWQVYATFSDDGPTGEPVPASLQQGQLRSILSEGDLKAPVAPDADLVAVHQTIGAAFDSWLGALTPPANASIIDPSVASTLDDIRFDVLEDDPSIDASTITVSPGTVIVTTQLDPDTYLANAQATWKTPQTQTVGRTLQVTLQRQPDGSFQIFSLS